MEIRKAVPEEFLTVMAFYDAVTDQMEGSEYPPRWEKGVYPEPEFIRQEIEKGQVFIGLEEGTVAAAMVINHQAADGYKDVAWGVDAPAEDIDVVHALGVLPGHHKKGFGRQMVKKALDMARENGRAAVRLDVLEDNLPAKRLYEGMGFRYTGHVKLFYEDTGITDFMLYEFAI